MPTNDNSGEIEQPREDKRNLRYHPKKKQNKKIKRQKGQRVWYVSKTKPTAKSGRVSIMNSAPNV